MDAKRHQPITQRRGDLAGRPYRHQSQSRQYAAAASLRKQPAMPAFIVLIACVCWLVAGCAITQSASPVRIGLLAPFEGRYREIGYNALYAARLALTDSARTDVELLPVDDGGSIHRAADRARALAKDTQVKAVIVIGYDASAETVQQALGDVPVVIVGNWLVAPQTDNVFILSHREIPAQLSSTEKLSIIEAAEVEAPFVGGDVLALEGFRRLRNNFDGITLVSSSSLPDARFRQHYLESDPFAVEPGLLATTVYDAVGIALSAIPASTIPRDDVRHHITQVNYPGINGQIRFAGGYWSNAPTHTYTFLTDGSLTLHP